jgi:hypothetical protein
MAVLVAVDFDREVAVDNLHELNTGAIAKCAAELTVAPAKPVHFSPQGR